ncbi:MAG: hypothetical protein RMJ17_03080 [Candidatus Aenigmarchaeota archaeon]|nr:hypothetical protein [Candidatus Aenigmarchaeota archaeon]MDW8149550.1 hypothetical protein [Candidatus Aenigmarchaeota archaeon]
MKKNEQNFEESGKVEELSKLSDEIKLIPAFQKIEKKEDLVGTLFAFFKTLTREEKIIFQILFDSINPLSIREIRKRYLLTYVSILEKDNKKEKILEIIKNLREKIEKEKDVSPSSLIENLNDAETSKLISEINKKILSYPKIPSYYKIKKILEYFENLGLVTKRELEGRKAESIWLLSPSFSKICSSVVSYIETKEERTSIEVEVYYYITGKIIDNFKYPYLVALQRALQ